MKIYNFNFRLGLPVVFSSPKSAVKVVWSRIIGIQIGDWFFGCVKGYKSLEQKGDA